MVLFVQTKPLKGLLSSPSLYLTLFLSVSLLTPGTLLALTAVALWALWLMKFVPSVSMQSAMQLHVALTVDTRIMFSYVLNGNLQEIKKEFYSPFVT
jgi:hypothetical protein